MPRLAPVTRAARPVRSQAGSVIAGTLIGVRRWVDWWRGCDELIRSFAPPGQDRAARAGCTALPRPLLEHFAVITATDLELRAGSRILLSGANLRVQPGDRIGLVGRNGAGKTTTLRVRAGESTPHAGDVSLAHALGYLPQDPREGDLSVLAKDRVLSARGLDELLREMEKSQSAMAELVDERERDAAVRRYGRLEDRFSALGGYGAESEAARICANLGLPERALSQPLGTLSGGQRRRVELARILFAASDSSGGRSGTTLLLDEPTNHLDADSVTWLREFLKAHEGGLVVISHDVDLLAAVVNKVWFLDAGRAEKLVAGLETEHRSDRVARIRFPEPASCGRVPLTAAGLSKSYGSLEVFSGIDLAVDRGSRVVVLGLNGAGKTTLLRLLGGRETADGGMVQPGHGLRIGYFAQEPGTLAHSAGVWENVRHAAPDAGEQQLRTLLGTFLFSGEQLAQPAGTLSGGEKTRLALAGLVCSGANVLLLDEPTNNLDPASRERVLDALRRYVGAVVLVTHDSGAVEALEPERVILLPDGTEDHWNADYLELV